MAPEPDILLLDEPCSGLDQSARQWFLDTLSGLARAGTSLVLATHREDELIPEITHVLCLENGRVAHQGPRNGPR
jgi:ABC-type molybdenum transport system ATPase subunit/photorepair protein PhrA